MATMLDAIQTFFDGRGWQYEAGPQGRYVRLGFTGDSGELQAFAQPREPEQQIVFYALCPLRVPPPRRPAVAELITRINWGMVQGNFEMDYADGEVRCKATIDLEGTEPTPALLKPIVIVPLAMMDRYLAALVAVIGGAEPVEALAAVE